MKAVQEDGSDILSERTFRYAATALSGGKWSSHQSACMRYVVTVSTQACLAAIKDWGVGEIGVFAPVPVRLGALVAALRL